MELMAFAFPHDSESPTFITEFPRILTEVANTFSVEFYTNDNRRFYSITRWDEHQRNERRASSRLPGPGDSESAPDKEFYGNQGFSDDGHGISVQSDGNTATGTEEQGNRGTVLTPPVVPLEGDVTAKDDSSSKPSKRRTSKTLIPEDWHPSEHHMQTASERGIDLVTEAEKFKAYADSHAKRYANWDQAFNNWLLNASNFNKPQQQGYRNKAQERYEQNMQRARNAQITRQAQQPQLTGRKTDNDFGF